MGQYLSLIALVVPDYDEAIGFYVDILGFHLIEDTPQSDGKRWVVVAPPGSRETRILLARAVNDVQTASIGNQTGGRVFLFLHTDDFSVDYGKMCQSGVHFEESPRNEPYGEVAVFCDPFGNRWDLVQFSAGNH
ncbi:MAG: VOC family protein [Rhizobiaceae bacterium]|nr:VOC family protein [Rhizobiaceae bacterium]